MNFSEHFLKFLSDKMTSLCNDQTWFSDTLTSARPLRVVKTLAFRLGFRHHPRGPVAVNALKNMFDPYSNVFCLVCGLTVQSTAMVMLRRPVNLTTLFLDKSIWRYEMEGGKK